MKFVAGLLLVAFIPAVSLAQDNPPSAEEKSLAAFRGPNSAQGRIEENAREASLGVGTR
jgi:hypothetical protein